MDKGIYIKEISRRYFIAVWAVGAAFALTFIALPIIDPGISPVFLLAVMVSAWRGGLGVGLFATFLSAMANAFVFLPPRFSFDLDQTELQDLAIFTVAAAIIGSLSAARKRAEEEREVLLVKEQSARIEAEQANRVKDDFLAAVSHELRTPLTTIKTLTRVMQRRQMTDEEREDYLADIAAECDREIDLVLNLLDISRIRAGGLQIQLQKVDVVRVLSACKKILQTQADENDHQVEIRFENGFLFARADEGALRRALCAVIENAIKYTPEGGRITLGARRTQDSVIVEIEDTGRGISEEDLPFVFDKFYRGHSAGDGSAAIEEEVPGIGLGLNLAKTLIQGMRGDIEVESEVGKGSRFRVTLPEAVSKAPSALAQAGDGNGTVEENSSLPSTEHIKRL